jgi:hypothetical protein
MQSALWLAPLALWLTRGHTDPESSPRDLLYLGLTALFWIGHRLCSTWLAYCTEAYRPLLRAQPVRFVVLPLVVTAGCFGVFLPSDAALPWTREQRLVGLAILDYALVTYHFAAQHFGALALYRTRAGRGACATTRRLDRLFALGVGGGLVFLADILAGAVAYQDLWVDRWLVPAWLASTQAGIRQGGRWCCSPRRPPCCSRRRARRDGRCRACCMSLASPPWWPLPSARGACFSSW